MEPNSEIFGKKDFENIFVKVQFEVKKEFYNLFNPSQFISSLSHNLSP